MTRLIPILILVLSVLGTILPTFAATRTAIMKQEEAQTERSVQIRGSDPGAPVTNQLWINTSEAIPKYYDGATNVQVGAKKGANADITSMSGVTGVLETPTIIKMAEQGSTPATPSAGQRKVYAKSNGLYQLDSSGIESKVGTGTGGAGGINLLTADDNNTFDDGVTSWTASGGTVAAETTTPLFGIGSLKWDASALSQTLSSAAKTPTQGLRDNGNCLAGISYKFTGTTGDYKLQAYDGSLVLSELSLEPSSTARDSFLGFSCPSSGTVLLRLIAGVADPAEITIDGPTLAGGSVHLGSNILLANISQSKFYGSANHANSTNCFWTTTSGSYASFAADADCAVPTVTGSASAPATKIPAIKFATLPAGTYQFIVRAAMQATNNAQCRIYDGTTSGGETSIVYPATTGLQGTVTGRFVYGSAQSNKTFELQCEIAGAGTLNIRNDAATDLSSVSTDFSVYYFPSQSQSTLVGVETSAQSWSGYHANTCAWPRTNTAYGDPTADATCSMVERTNRNFGTVTSSGSTLPNIVFTPSRLGRYYVCALVNVKDSAGQYGVRLWDGTTEIAEASGNITNQVTQPVCGIYNVASLSSVTLSVQSRSVTGTVTIGPEGAGGGESIEWLIYPIDQQMPMPYLVKTVTSSAEKWQVEAVHFGGSTPYGSVCSSSPCTIWRQSGGISSVTRTSVGKYSINFVASTFSATPVCDMKCNAATGSSNYHAQMDETNNWTASLIKIYGTDGSYALTDTQCSLTCQGPK